MLMDVSVGALFAVYGAGVLGVSAFRRMQGNRQFFSEVGEDGLSKKRCVVLHLHPFSLSNVVFAASELAVTLSLS